MIGIYCYNHRVFDAWLANQPGAQRIRRFPDIYRFRHEGESVDAAFVCTRSHLRSHPWMAFWILVTDEALDAIDSAAQERIVEICKSTGLTPVFKRI